MNWLMMLLPAGLSTLAAYLMGRDKNDTGADDSYARLIMEIAPAIPELISGRTPSDTATDKVFLAIKKVADTYLQGRAVAIAATESSSSPPTR